MFTTPARYALALAFALGAMHFNGASARAEKCNTAIPEYSGESSSSLSLGAPVAVGTMRDRMLTMGGTSVVRFSVARYFTDPDGDDLTYSFSLSGSSVSAEMCGSILKIVAIRNTNGNTRVTVTASDRTGSATQSFWTCVNGNCPSAQNNDPVPEGTIADTTFTQKTSPISFFVSPYFSDPDGDDLTYSPSVSPAGKVQASITDSTLTLTAVSKGTATVTVTATDPSSADAAQVFDATIANSVVEAIGTIPDTTVAVGASLVFNVSPYFRDPDPEDRPRLRYLGASLNRDLASARVSDSTLTITGLSAGRARIVALALETPITEVPSQYFYVTVVADTTLAVEITGPDSIASGVENTWEAVASEGNPPYTYRWDYATGCIDSEHSPADDSCVWRWISAGTGSSLTQTITTANSLTGVRVTATDSATPTASSAMDSVIVSVNHAPDTVGTIAARTIVLGHPDVSFSVAGFFSDPDDDNLTYEASSSSDDTVGVSISGSTLTLEAKKVNTTPETVTVTAMDPGGLSSPAQEFAVTIENPPSTDLTAFIAGDNLTSIVSGTEYTWGSRVTGGTPPYTYSWRYATNCVDEGLLNAAPCVWQWIGAGSGTSYTKTITTTKTSAQIRLIVSDSAAPADSVTKRLNLTVTQPVSTDPVDPVIPPPPVTPNRRPVVDRDIPDQTLTAGGSSATFNNLDNYFSDPDPDDDLDYSAESSNSSAARVSVSDPRLTITPVAQGSATVTVTADDG